MSKTIQLIIGMLTIIGVCFGAWFYVDEKKADCADVQKVEQKVGQMQTDLEVHKLDNYLKSVQQRIWTIKERHGEIPRDRTVKEELQKLEVEKQSAEKKLDVLQKSK